jgi:hypothetical protein
MENLFVWAKPHIPGVLYEELGGNRVGLGFETRAGSRRIGNATVPKMKLGCSGRKSAREKKLGRADDNVVSFFTVSLKCGAPVDSGPDWSQPGMVPVETMFCRDSLCAFLQLGQWCYLKCQFPVTITFTDPSNLGIHSAIPKFA